MPQVKVYEFKHKLGDQIDFETKYVNASAIPVGKIAVQMVVRVKSLPKNLDIIKSRILDLYAGNRQTEYLVIFCLAPGEEVTIENKLIKYEHFVGGVRKPQWIKYRQYEMSGKFNPDQVGQTVRYKDKEGILVSHQYEQTYFIRTSFGLVMNQDLEILI
ncbi:MAG: hypothetical protein KatS3mg087_0588 [Patescibacteria group bacterium]|nr:MAG: hypothetical protein KatS3mg087_0588 [Patescibacteria group bacterium]